MQHLKNIFFLGIKELIELLRDHCMMILILYSFSLGIYVAAIGTPDFGQKSPIAIVDQDNTQLSNRVADAFLPPLFLDGSRIPMSAIDPGMDRGDFTFAIVFPPDFQKNILAGKQPEVQLNVDATRMSQAFSGSGYVQQIVETEVDKFVNRDEEVSRSRSLAQLDLRNRFNPNLIPTWFGGLNQLVNSVTMLAIVLIGAALIRERERGTLEHLLVMPVTPFEIMCAKIWAMLVVVLIASIVSVLVILKYWLGMPIEGSLFLFMLGVSLHLFAVTSMGITLACIAENMPQMGMLLILVLIPMIMLSGGQTPMESMPVWVQTMMQFAPTTHFVAFCQQILFRAADWDVVWKPFLKLFLIGSALFFYSLTKFRRTATA